MRVTFFATVQRMTIISDGRASTAQTETGRDARLWNQVCWKPWILNIVLTLRADWKDAGVSLIECKPNVLAIDDKDACGKNSTL